MAAIDREFVLEHFQTLFGVAVSAVGDPSVGLHQHGWAEVFILAVDKKKCGTSACVLHNKSCQMSATGH